MIVNTASNAAFDGQIGQAAYSASKAGVAGMTLPVARDLASKGIRVVHDRARDRPTRRCSAPMRDDIRESLTSQVPFPKRLGRAEEFAALVRHIVENEYLNGEMIRLDGALRMGPAETQRRSRWPSSSRSSRTARVAIVTIDNPPVNALSRAAARGARGRVRRARRDSDERARSCSAARARRRSSRARTSPSSRRCASDRGGRGGAARRAGSRSSPTGSTRAATPVVAAIHGYCLGGGLELAMACDIRVAAEDAQLGQPEIKLGLIPGGGGTQRLPRLVGHGRALLLNMTGDPISGAQAYEWGLVERVVPREELLDAALEIARTLAERSPHAMGVIKELAPRDARPADRRGPAARGEGASRAASGARTAREGVTAFLEKRAAAVHGHDEGGRPPRDRRRRSSARGRARAGGRRRPVVVEVRAAGINFADILIRRGDVPAAAAAAGDARATRSRASSTAGAWWRSAHDRRRVRGARRRRRRLGRSSCRRARRSPRAPRS